MRAVIQRVKRASVTVDGEIVGEIKEPGLCVLLGVTHSDADAQANKVAQKIAQLKVLRGADGSDEQSDRLSAEEAGAPILLVSQFTLYADVRKGRKPSWSHAAPGNIAEPMYECVAKKLRETYGLHVETGSFGAMMDVELVNDGPFTLLVEVEA
ncbi:D-aminoacyl-tRNA deacylase [Actinotignum urinale]|uniref:D-aminoacyl-tRNA deacylase n=1 Tax=Actinotignum urinale TaxID=190146 RepID=UPI00280B4D86|nr:D-aminoacyl-tRNA deacylase [Actinotignum urinale]